MSYVRNELRTAISCGVEESKVIVQIAHQQDRSVVEIEVNDRWALRLTAGEARIVARALVECARKLCHT